MIVENQVNQPTTAAKHTLTPQDMRQGELQLPPLSNIVPATVG